MSDETVRRNLGAHRGRSLVVRQGLRTFLELHDDIRVVGEARTGRGRGSGAPASARRGADGPGDA